MNSISGRQSGQTKGLNGPPTPITCCGWIEDIEGFHLSPQSPPQRHYSRRNSHDNGRRRGQTLRKIYPLSGYIHIQGLGYIYPRPFGLWIKYWILSKYPEYILDISTFLHQMHFVPSCQPLVVSCAPHGRLLQHCSGELEISFL